MHTGSRSARSRASAVRLAAAVTAIGALAAALVGVEEKEAVAAPADASCRTLPVDQDAPLRSDLARLDYGVDGSGVTIGIISNTFAQAPENSTVEQNIEGGLLPGAGNPCGYTTPVEVLIEGPAENADDEGRGMAQLVHGVAPGAKILFASGEGDEGMLGAIVALAEAGANVIVDDLGEFGEPFFQRSIEGVVIQEFVDEGGVYLSAAGNATVTATNPIEGDPATPVGSFWTTAYRPTECSSAVAEAFTNASEYVGEFDCMDFDATESADSTAGYEIEPWYFAPHEVPAPVVAMQWAEPFGAAAASFQMLALITTTDADGVTTTQSFLADEFGDGQPGTIFGGLPMPYDSDTASLEIALVRETDGTAEKDITPPIAFFFDADGPEWIMSAEYWESNETDTIGNTIMGHNGDPAAISVAAAPAHDPLTLESFSSYGPVTYYFTPFTGENAGEPLPEPVTYTKPDITSIDAVRNTVLGPEVEGEPGVYVFSGTSAATPNAGAVVALALQLDPTLSSAEILDIMSRTATPIASQYVDFSEANTSGAGLINAQAVLAEVAAGLPVPVPVPAGGGSQPAQLAATGADLPAGPLTFAALLALAGAALVVGRRRTA